MYGKILSKVGDNMKVGYAIADITPDLGVELAGYLKTRIADRVHTPLYAKVLMFRQRRKTYVWISLDLIAIDHVFLRLLKKEIEKLHFHFHDIQVYATHTHSGPKGCIDNIALQDVFGTIDVKYLRHVACRCIHAMKEAMIDLDDFVLRMNKGLLTNVATSRHDPTIEINNYLTTLLFSRDKKEDVLLYHFANHPTILHADSTAISSDFVGGIEKALSNKFNQTMFLNGSCGNISTRFTRVESSEQEVNRIGALIAKQILDLVEDSKPVDLTSYKAFHFTYEMKKRLIDKEEEALVKLKASTDALEKGLAGGLEDANIRVLESYYEGAQLNYQLAKHNTDTTHEEIHIAIIKLNHLKFIAIPGELFHSLELELVCDDCLVVNYANGYHAYIADEDAYKKGYYESLTSYYDASEGKKLIAFIQAKIKEVS